MDKTIEKNQTGHQERFPGSEKIKPESDGWLSPAGTYYQVGVTEHDESAKFLITYSSEVKTGEKKKFSYPFQRVDYDNKNNREKLRDLGWILIRGHVLRSEDALNFTIAQLKAISEAGIAVISAFDGSTEYSSNEVQGIVKKIKTSFAESKVIQKIRNDLDEGRLSSRLTPFRQETIRGIEQFNRDPFRTTIYITEVFNYKKPNEHEVLPMEIFNLMSKGYSEEVKIFTDRFDYTYRVIDLETGGKIWVERSKYSHDGLSGGMVGDFNNYISIYVVDDVLMREKLSKLFGSESKTPLNPNQISFQKKGGYFEKYFSEISPKK